MPAQRGASSLAIWTAMASVYIIWGSTYLAIAIAVQTLPPLFSAGLRFLVAGLVLLAIVAARRGLHVVRAQLVGASRVGRLLLVGGIGFVVLGAAAGEVANLEPSTWSTSSLLAMAYLVVFGSLVAFTAYSWLLQNAPVSLVATYAYVNPVIAVLLGALILAEPVTPSIVLGAA